MERTDLKWDDIQLFLVIARSKTLTGAAPTLGLSQPTLGRRLRALEGAVGAPLFVRTSEGLRLTADGRSILCEAEAMERSALAVKRLLSSEYGALVGLLRVASRDWLMRHLLAAPLSTFTRLHPGLTLILAQDCHKLDLTSRDAEVAFRFAFVGRPAFSDPHTIQRRLATISHGVYASCEYLAERGGWPNKGGGDLHRLIVEDNAAAGPLEENWLLRRFPSAKVRISCSCRDTMALACAQGAGISLLPRVIGDYYGLERLDAGNAHPEGGLWLGYHGDLRTLGRLRELIDHVVATVQRDI